MTFRAKNFGKYPQDLIKTQEEVSPITDRSLELGTTTVPDRLPFGGGTIKEAGGGWGWCERSQGRIYSPPAPVFTVGGRRGAHTSSGYLPLAVQGYPPRLAPAAYFPFRWSGLPTIGEGISSRRRWARAATEWRGAGRDLLLSGSGFRCRVRFFELPVQGARFGCRRG